MSLAALEALVRHKGRIKAMHIADELNISLDTWKKNRKEMLRDLCENGEFTIFTPPGERSEYVYLSSQVPKVPKV